MSKRKEELKYTKKSIWGEFSALSGVMILVLVLVVIGSIAAFVFMNMRPEKKMKIIDDAEIFSESDILAYTACKSSCARVDSLIPSNLSSVILYTKIPPSA